MLNFLKKQVLSRQGVVPSIHISTDMLQAQQIKTSPTPIPMSSLQYTQQGIQIVKGDCLFLAVPNLYLISTTAVEATIITVNKGMFIQLHSGVIGVEVDDQFYLVSSEGLVVRIPDKYEYSFKEITPDNFYTMVGYRISQTYGLPKTHIKDYANNLIISMSLYYDAKIDILSTKVVDASEALGRAGGFVFENIFEKQQQEKVAQQEQRRQQHEAILAMRQQELQEKHLKNEQALKEKQQRKREPKVQENTAQAWLSSMRGGR